MLTTRIATLIIVGMISSGCTAMLYSSGKHYSVLGPGRSPPRSKVIDEIGSPNSSGADDDDRLYDVFIVKGMVPDAEAATVYLMAAGCTFLVSELFTLPVALWRLPGRIRATNKITTHYDQDEFMIWYRVERIQDSNQPQQTNSGDK